MVKAITPDGTKAFHKVLLDAINNLLLDGATTREVITAESNTIHSKLNEIDDQLKIIIQHNEFITNEVITPIDVS